MTTHQPPASPQRKFTDEELAAIAKKSAAALGPALVASLNAEALKNTDQDDAARIAAAAIAKAARK